MSSNIYNILGAVGQFVLGMQVIHILLYKLFPVEVNFD